MAFPHPAFRVLLGVSPSPSALCSGSVREVGIQTSAAPPPTVHWGPLPCPVSLTGPTLTWSGRRALCAQADQYGSELVPAAPGGSSLPSPSPVHGPDPARDSEGPLGEDGTLHISVACLREGRRCPPELLAKLSVPCGPGLGGGSAALRPSPQLLIWVSLGAWFTGHPQLPPMPWAGPSLPQPPGPSMVLSGSTFLCPRLL